MKHPDERTNQLSACRYLIEQGAFLVAIRSDTKRPRTTRPSDLGSAPWTKHRDEGYLKPGLNALLEGRSTDLPGVFPWSVDLGDCRLAVTDLDGEVPNLAAFSYWLDRVSELLGADPLYAIESTEKRGRWHAGWAIADGSGREKDGRIVIDGVEVGELRWSRGCLLVVRAYEREIEEIANAVARARGGETHDVLTPAAVAHALLKPPESPPVATSRSKSGGSSVQAILAAGEGTRHNTIKREAARAGRLGHPLGPIETAARSADGEDGARTARDQYAWGQQQRMLANSAPTGAPPDGHLVEQAHADPLRDEEQSEIDLQAWREGAGEAIPIPDPVRIERGADVDAAPDVILSEQDMTRWVRPVATNIMRWQEGRNQWMAWSEDQGWRPESPGWILAHLQDAWNGVLHREQPTKQGVTHQPDPIREGRVGFGKAVRDGLSALAGIRTLPEDWDAHPDELGLPGGRKVSLSTGVESDQDMADLLAKATRHPPASLAGTRFARFLEEAFPDPHTRLAAQVALGAGLSPEPGAYTTAFQGRERSGKTTIQTACTDILGPYAAPLSTALIGGEADPFTRMSARGRLQGLRQGWISETSEALTLADDAIKALGGGGDRIVARGIGKDVYEFEASHDLYIVTNFLPYLRRRDPAIVDRMRIIPMDQSRAAGDRENLALLFRDEPKEGGAVLSWLLEGFRFWRERGDCPPSPEMERRKRVWLDSCDPLGAFIREELAEGPGVRLRDLAKAMRGWLKERMLQPPSYLATTQALRGQLDIAGFEVGIGAGRYAELRGYVLPGKQED